MTDSTSHNMGVDDIVAEKLGSEHIPEHLLCHVHPACMFTRKKDLATLVTSGGPFTSAEEVEVYLLNPAITDQQKNSRLYTEVRYAKNTSVSFPKDSDVFRLKRRYKNLPTSEYGVNLITYLNKVTCNVNMDYDDFKNAIKGLQKNDQ